VRWVLVERTFSPAGETGATRLRRRAILSHLDLDAHAPQKGKIHWTIRPAPASIACGKRRQLDWTFIFTMPKLPCGEATFRTYSQMSACQLCCSRAGDFRFAATRLWKKPPPRAFQRAGASDRKFLFEASTRGIFQCGILALINALTLFVQPV
jgi:hypothetical protein